MALKVGMGIGLGRNALSDSLIDSDDFNRSTLNLVYTKSGSNPLDEDSHGDPGIWYEDGTFYLFATSGTLDIDMASSTDGETFGAFTEVLSRGGSGEWDEFKISDPYITKVGETYYMYYAGNKTTGGDGTTHAIGLATASSITGPWTKHASNPLVTHATEGVNEPSVTYDPNDTPKFRMLTTSGTAGNQDDVGRGDIRYFSSADGITWTDEGDVLTGTWQDQEQYKLTGGGTSNWAMLVNDILNDVYILTSTDFTTWSNSELIIARGGVSSYDENAVFAPASVLVGDQWSTYYQAGDSGNNYKPALATAPRNVMRRWVASDGTWNVTSNQMRRTGDLTDEWDTLLRTIKTDPPYRMECDIHLVTSTFNGFTGGLRIAQGVSRGPYDIDLQAQTDQIRIVENRAIAYGTASIPGGIDYDTWYKLRVTVTSGRIRVDWWDGSAWNNDVIDTTLDGVGGTLDLTAALLGLGSYYPNFDAADVYWDNYKVYRT